jgi:(5-formylfuran-3-yl)methyl phosphate synthase
MRHNRVETLHKNMGMTQLLVSVKNLVEALLAEAQGADVIDLKDPSVGALGALNPNKIKEIVQVLRKQNPQICISATIGENFADLSAMHNAIIQTADLGVDIVKLPLNGHAHDLKSLFDILKLLSFKTQMAKPLSRQKITLFGIIFADIAFDLSVIEASANAGLIGVMLDTQDKTRDLLRHANHVTLLNFVNSCKKNGLKSGIAGSLKLQYIENLVTLNSSYMGFRGGLCDNLNRNNNLDVNKLKMAKLLLHKGDKKVKISYENSGTTLNC